MYFPTSERRVLLLEFPFNLVVLVNGSEHVFVLLLKRDWHIP